jgi:hypothetical protein
MCKRYTAEVMFTHKGELGEYLLVKFKIIYKT